MVRNVRPRVARVAGRWWARLDYARRVEPKWLAVTRLQVPVRGLPHAFAGFRIAHLSDFHLHDHATIERAHEAVRLANAAKPDLVALTGDFIHNGHGGVEVAGRIAGSLKARHGIVAVLGNHDWAVRSYWLRRYHLRQRTRRHLRRALRYTLRAYGVQVLQNDAVVIEHHGAQLAIVGLEDLWSRRCDVDRAMRRLNPQLPRILLAHNPMAIEALNGHRCDLMLAGHTHGGQVKLLQHRLFALGKAVRHYRAGLFETKQGFLYVTTGVGCGSFRMRYGVRPEVAIVELVPA